MQTSLLYVQLQWCLPNYINFRCKLHRLVDLISGDNIRQHRGCIPFDFIADTSFLLSFPSIGQKSFQLENAVNQHRVDGSRSSRERGFLGILDIGYRRGDRPFWCTTALLCLRNKQRQFRDPPRGWMDSTERPILYSPVRLPFFFPFHLAPSDLIPLAFRSALYVFFTSGSLRFLPLTLYCPNLLRAFLKKFEPAYLPQKREKRFLNVSSWNNVYLNPKRASLSRGTD